MGGWDDGVIGGFLMTIDAKKCILFIKLMKKITHTLKRPVQHTRIHHKQTNNAGQVNYFGQAADVPLLYPSGAQSVVAEVRPCLIGFTGSWWLDYYLDLFGCPPFHIYNIHTINSNPYPFIIQQLATGVQQLSSSGGASTASKAEGGEGEIPLQKGFSTGEQFTPLRMRVGACFFYFGLRGGGG